MRESSTCGSQPMEEGRDICRHFYMIGRMRKLEHLGLAEPLGPARWRLSERAEPTLRLLSERNDIIKSIHRGLADQHIDGRVDEFAHDGERGGQVDWTSCCLRPR